MDAALGEATCQRLKPDGVHVTRCAVLIDEQVKSFASVIVVIGEYSPAICMTTLAENFEFRLGFVLSISR